MKLSIVSTLYRSAEFIEEFVRRSSLEASKITDDFEIVLVDDGSPDDSLLKALQLQKTQPKIKVIELSRNFGHHKAMMTALEHASGDLVFLIDVDLEESPELLSAFYGELQKGSRDVVYGVQKNRKGDFMKRAGGALAWRMIGWLLPIHVPANQSTVRLMTSQYVKALVQHKESRTAIGGLWVITGFKQIAYVFDKTCRKGSSYSFFKRIGMLLDSITSFSEVPLYGVFYLGCVIFFMSVGVTLYLIFKKLTGMVLDGWVSVMLSMWGLGGLILIALGIIGLYISRIFIETKHRPYVIIRNIHSGSNEGGC